MNTINHLKQEIKNDVRHAILFAHLNHQCNIEKFIQSIDQSLSEQLNQLIEKSRDEGFQHGQNAGEKSLQYNMEDIKEDIIKIIKSKGNVRFGAKWIRHTLNDLRSGDKEPYLYSSTVDQILKSMIADGTLQSQDVDCYCLTE